jgi:hypothetical protein
MLGRPRLAAAGVLAMLLALSGCGGGTISTDEWLDHQLPDDMSKLGSMTTASADPGTTCRTVGEWVDQVRDHPHPEDKLLSDGWDHFLDVADELSAACVSGDPAQMVPAFERFRDAQTVLVDRMPST